MFKFDSLSGAINLGPKSVQALARAGITTIHEIRRVGAAAAFVRVKRAEGNISLNLLWALEGALSGLHWQDVAGAHRLSLLIALEDYEAHN